MKQQDPKAVPDGKPGYAIDRRSALRKIAIGTGVLTGLAVLPESWTRPIIQQIVLPAHAATSGSTLHDPCTVTLLSGDNASAEVTIAVNGFVTPPVGNLDATITATAVGGAGASTTAQTKTSADGTFSAILTIGGGPGITAVNVVTTVEGAAGAARCSVNMTAQPSIVLTQCVMSLNSGDTSTESFNPGVEGSVNPPTGGIPLQLDFTFIPTGTGPAGPNPQFLTLNTTTGGTGTYAVGPAPNQGPYSSASVIVTSPGLGSTTCSVTVPDPT